MSRPVYSLRFLGVQNFSGSLTIRNDTPNTWVLRDFDASYDGGFGVTVRLIGSAGQTIHQWQTPPGLKGSNQWQGRQVINPGEQFTISTTDGADVTVSGYSLSPT